MRKETNGGDCAGRPNDAVNWCAELFGEGWEEIGGGGWEEIGVEGVEGEASCSDEEDSGFGPPHFF